MSFESTMQNEVALRKQNELIESIKSLEAKIDTVMELLQSKPVKVVRSKKNGKSVDAHANS